MDILTGLKPASANYSIAGTISESSFSISYEGMDDAGKRVVIQVLNAREMKPLSLARFRDEYAKIIPATGSISGFVPILDLVSHDALPALVLDCFGDETMRRRFIGGRPALDDFFTIAAQLARALGELHVINIAHRSIRPEAVFMRDDVVRISDFGVNASLTGMHEDIFNPEVVRGILPYISPEQTGRINHAVDHRSDLYSVGALFYELLTGAPPFTSQEPMEIIHAHIARSPVPPKLIDPAVPAPLSDIVMKLLEKTADDRYQSGYGLLADLNRCGEMMKRGFPDSPFPLGARDMSPRFILPHTIVGRDNERRALLSAFERAAEKDAASGGMDILLVKGDPGIGKSALIQELQRPVILKNGFFLVGKNDELQRNLPYRSLIQAFNVFVDSLLKEPENRLDSWKKTIQEAVGKNGTVLTGVLPKIGLIIGRQPEVTALPAEASQKRFHGVLLNFIRAIPSADRPLVLCFEDLQWADHATINFLSLVAGDDHPGNTLLILSYRDSALIHSSHVTDFIAGIERKKSGVLTAITVGPITGEETARYVSRFIRKESEETRELGAFIHAKTGGNPFFINQFMKSIHTNRLFYFDEESGWRCDIKAVKKLPIPDDVVDLLMERVNWLDDDTRSLLMACSCFGGQFNLDEVAAVTGAPNDRIIASLRVIENEGLLNAIDGAHKLSHDRIIEAVYSLIPPDERKRLHYQIGRMYLSTLSAADTEERITLIVNHLNAGRVLIGDQSEKRALVKLNIAAAEKAKKSIAYTSALQYYHTALELGGDEIWKDDHGAAIALYTNTAETAFLCADMDGMKRLGEIVLAKGKNLLEKIKIYELNIESLYAQNKLIDGLREGLAVIDRLGHPLPRHPGRMHVLLELIRLKAVLRRYGIASLVDAPDMDNPHILALMHAMKNIGTSAYKTTPLLIPIIALRGVRLSLKHGISPITAFSVAAYGMIQCGVLGKIDEGYVTGKVAISLAERSTGEWMRPRTWHLVGCMILHWKIHIRETLERIHYAKNLALDAGETESATSSLHLYCLYSFLSGKELKSLSGEIAESLSDISRFRQETNYNYCALLHQTVLNLINVEDEPALLKGDAYDETRMAPVHVNAKDKTALCLLHIYKMIMHCYEGRYDSAAEHARAAESMIDSILGSALTPVYYFFDSLILCALSRGKKADGRIRNNQKKLRRWAGHAPMNCAHKYDLVEAERCVRSGKREKAVEFYARAISGAREHRFIQEEALANERAAAYFRSIQDEELTAEHANQAFLLYAAWGSGYNAQRILRTYGQQRDPREIRTETASAPDALDPRDDVPGRSSPDYYALIQSLLALSGEINLEALISRIMHIILQNSGAQRGVLALMHDGDLFIEAEGNADHDEVTILKRVRADDFRTIPHHVVDYVRRTKETVVLDDAVHEGLFVDDPHIRRRGIRSLLCMHILRGHETTGIVYLENALTAGVFNPVRFEILRLLTVQAAISLENSLLFEKQREAENELTRKYEEIQSHYEEMEAMNEQLEETFRDLEDANRSLANKAHVLQQSEERYRLLVETMTEGLCMVDSDGQFVFVNDALCDMLGYVEQEMVGRPVCDFLDETNKIILSDQLAKRKSGMKEPYELRWNRKDASPVYSIVSPQTIFDSHNNVTGSFSVITNITERRKAEINQERMREQLLQSQKLEAIGTLAGGIAHDFNNQLTAIMGYAQLLIAETPQGDPRSIEMKEIMKAAERSAALTGQLLAFSRRQLLKQAELDLNVIVYDMSSMLRRVIGEDIELVINLYGDLELIHADRSQVEQIIMNLTVNARDALAHGGRLVIKTENVRLDEERCSGLPDSRPGSFVSLAIIDTGTGIHPDIQKNIFEPFFTTKEKGKGTGLGLSVVYGIIKQHDGWINMTSEPDRGATFTVFFPSLMTGARGDAGETEHHVEPKGRGEVVLIVEDQDEVCAFARTALERNGYRTFSAATAREAEEIIRREGAAIDILFCDVVLPDESGVILATRLVKTNEALRVLLTSGYTDDKAQWDRIAGEHFAFLQKPYTLSKLLSSLAELRGVN